MADINASDLIAKFQYAINNKWGYIYGTAGIKWTAERQKAATRETTVKYGKQWIGHMVADCSGLFHWAFAQLGGYMYHGSNTMYDKYCVSKGKLKAGKRTDGNGLKPGTAVFTGTENDHGHVGLYIGDGNVIEAASTQSGVIKSKVTKSKWTYWGELKGVKYGDAPKPEPIPEGYAEVTGKKVALRKDPSKKSDVIMRIDTGKMVKVETPPPSEWEYVSYNGKKGYMMKEFLNEG